MRRVEFHVDTQKPLGVDRGSLFSCKRLNLVPPFSLHPRDPYGPARMHKLRGSVLHPTWSVLEPEPSAPPPSAVYTRAVGSKALETGPRPASLPGLLSKREGERWTYRDARGRELPFPF